MEEVRVREGFRVRVSECFSSVRVIATITVMVMDVHGYGYGYGYGVLVMVMVMVMVRACHTSNRFFILHRLPEDQSKVVTP